MKRTIDLYVEAKYPRESIETLEWLESCCERLGSLLESYRHLQPDEKLFSPETIAKIAHLHMLEEANTNSTEEDRSLRILSPQEYTDLGVYAEGLF